MTPFRRFILAPHLFLKQKSVSFTPTRTGHRFCSNFRSLKDWYENKVREGYLHNNPAQLQTIKLLDKLASMTQEKELLRQDPSKFSLYKEKFSRGLKGVYLFGEVGTGKTMLMDAFFAHANVSSKRRVHFNEFMLEVHKRIHLHKKKSIATHGRSVNLNRSPEQDSIILIAREIALEAQLLCFDEFQVTDICDAMILVRLFGELWRCGVVLVATSNRHPTDLYQNGLNRGYFLPFIDMLQRHTIVRNMGIETDYRLSKTAKTEGEEGGGASYFTPLTVENTEKLRRVFQAQLTQDTLQHETATVETIPVMMGRALTLQQANQRVGCCYVTFQELCATEKGAADYQALVQHYDTVYMESIPQLSVLMHNEARRLITLIDALYTAHARFFWSGEVAPQHLFRLLTAEELSETSSGGGGTLSGTDHTWGGGSNRGGGEGGEERDAVVIGDERSALHQPSVPKKSSELEYNPNLRGSQQRSVTLSLNNHAIESPSSEEGNKDDAESPSLSQSPLTTSLPQQPQQPQKPQHQQPFPSSSPPEMQVLEGELASVQELSFAFRRAASRLVEMASQEYATEWEQRKNNKCERKETP